jgi:hypothetical protein
MCLLAKDAAMLEGGTSTSSASVFHLHCMVEHFETNDYSYLEEVPARYFRIMDKTVIIVILRGTWWHNWLRHCATSQKVVGSIPDGVIGIFHRLNPSGHTIALWSTLFLTEMSTRAVSWGVKAAGA